MFITNMNMVMFILFHNEDYETHNMCCRQTEEFDVLYQEP